MRAKLIKRMNNSLKILELVELLWAIASSTSCSDIPDKMAAVTFVASGPDTLVKSLW